MGTNDRAGRRFQTRHAQTFHRAWNAPAGRTFWKSIVTGIEKQIEEVGLSEPRKYIGFLGTLFVFVAAASLCTVIPGYDPPTASLSTTAALALSVFVAVPFFGIAEQGVLNYLKSYATPTPIMLPFNIISELSRTLALAIRLFGILLSKQVQRPEWKADAFSPCSSFRAS